MEKKLYSVRVTSKDRRVKHSIFKAIVLATSREEALDKFNNDILCGRYNSENNYIQVHECGSDVWSYS